MTKRQRKEIEEICHKHIISALSGLYTGLAMNLYKTQYQEQKKKQVNKDKGEWVIKWEESRRRKIKNRHQRSAE